MTMLNIKINKDRLWRSLMDLAKIGATPGGGVNRQALTDLDKEARDLFSSWCSNVGCTMRVDPIGNLFARRRGTDDSLPAIMVGSHIDSQPTGGKFDGAYGVMAGLEVLRTLHDANISTQRSVEVVVWMNEEGVRFAPSMMGSLVYAGQLDLNDTLAIQDAEGKNVGQELVRIGARGKPDTYGHPVAYFEVHIEQGPILEAQCKTIGVVSGAQGQCWYQITLKGIASHAGTTPMGLRRDALVGAASVVTALNRIGLGSSPGCATAGRMLVVPNSPNVIPESVYMTAEIRHPDDKTRAVMEQELKQAINSAANENGLEVELIKVLEQPAAPFDVECIAAVRSAAKRHDYPYMDIVSGAAHDAVALSRIVPTGMIFIPCADGISHNELESATPEDLAAGCQVLLDSVLAYSFQDANN